MLRRSRKSCYDAGRRKQARSNRASLLVSITWPLRRIDDAEDRPRQQARVTTAARWSRFAAAAARATHCRDASALNSRKSDSSSRRAIMTPPKMQGLGDGNSNVRPTRPPPTPRARHAVI